MRFGGIISSILGGLAGGGAVAVAQFFQADRVAEDAAYVSIVQSRVATCFAIADHHRLVHQLEEQGDSRTER